MAGAVPEGPHSWWGTCPPTQTTGSRSVLPCIWPRWRRLTPLSVQVELLVMKALSVGLVKGSIDEVDGRVHMTWVQPRVLDLQQVTGAIRKEMGSGQEPSLLPPGT